jgi:hypothetical protein
MRDGSVASVWRLLELLLDNGAALRPREVTPTEIERADVRALLLFVVAKADNYRRVRNRSPLVAQLPDGSHAVVAVQELATLVALNRDEHSSSSDIRLERLEILCAERGK